MCRRQSRYGWRATIGVVGTAGGFYAPQFYRMAPPGVDMRFTGTPLERSTVENLTRIGDYVPDAARILAPFGCDVMLCLTTTGTLMKGVGYDQELIRKMEEASGIRATTSSTAMLAGFRKLGIKKVCVTTAYTDDVNEHVKRFIEGNGFEVLKINGHQLADVKEVNNTTPYETAQLVKEVDCPGADGIYISCGGLDVLDIIEPLECDRGKPVLTTIQSSFWHAFRLAGVKESIHGFGRLLTEQL